MKNKLLVIFGIAVLLLSSQRAFTMDTTPALHNNWEYPTSPDPTALGQAGIDRAVAPFLEQMRVRREYQHEAQVAQQQAAYAEQLQQQQLDAEAAAQKRQLQAETAALGLAVQQQNPESALPSINAGAITKTGYNVFDKEKNLAENGNAAAQRFQGIYYLGGSGDGTPNYVEAAKWFRKAADQNDVFSELCLGDCYAAGNGVPKAYSEALKWYRKAGEQGNAIAQYDLGCYYKFGKGGVANDQVEAAKWFRKAADQGNAEAQYSLGYCYCKGEGVETNIVAGYKWCNLASAQGNEYAKKSLSVLEQNMTPEQIAEGQRLALEFQPQKEWAPNNSNSTENPTASAVVQPDTKQAEADIKQFEINKAKAELGDAQAQYNLGNCYYAPTGVGFSGVEAAKWYRKAAEQGNAEAQFQLGTLYRLGIGVRKNMVEAVKWLNLASAQGCELDKKTLFLIEQKMTPEQIAEGQRLAREFKPHTESAAGN